MVLVGMQPVFTQVPPNHLRSIIATFIPALVSRWARKGPACPVPMMIASQAMGMDWSRLGDAAAQQRGRRGLSRARHAGLLLRLRHLVAFAGRQEQVGVYAVLPRVQIVIPPAQVVERLMSAALYDAAMFHHQDLLCAPDSREAVGDHKR